MTKVAVSMLFIQVEHLLDFFVSKSYQLLLVLSPYLLR